MLPIIIVVFMNNELVYVKLLLSIIISTDADMMSATVNKYFHCYLNCGCLDNGVLNVIIHIQ